MTRIESLEGWKWWRKAWYDSMGARIELFVVGLAIAVTYAALSRFPTVRGLLPHLLAPWIHFAAFEFSRTWREKKTRDFRTLLVPFQDREVFKRLLPLSIAGLTFGLAYLSCNWLAERSLGLGALRFLVSLLELSSLLFAVPLVAVQKRAPLESLSTSLKLVINNLGAFSVFYGVGILSVLLGICTLGIGFLILLPLYVCLPYLVYHQFYPR